MMAFFGNLFLIAIRFEHARLAPSVSNIYANPPFSNFQLRDWNGLALSRRPLIINLEIKTKPDAGAVPVSGSLGSPTLGKLAI